MKNLRGIREVMGTGARGRLFMSDSPLIMEWYIALIERRGSGWEWA